MTMLLLWQCQTIGRSGSRFKRAEMMTVTSPRHLSHRSFALAVAIYRILPTQPRLFFLAREMEGHCPLIAGMSNLGPNIK